MDEICKRCHRETECRALQPLPASCACTNFKARIFRNTRLLRVWLPPGYSQPENEGRHYPVFYLNDGQNLFDPATAYIGVDWQADEAATRLIGEGTIPPLIIVGIDNAQKDRAKEYLPYRSIYPPVFRPQGKRYPDFLLNEVMPFVGERYRIARGARKHGSRRIIARCDHFSLYRDRSPGSVRRVADGEPVVVYFEPSASEIQSGISEWPAKSIHGDRNQGGGR